MKKIILLFFIIGITTQCISQHKNVTIKKVEVSIFKEHLKNKEIQLIDVRTQEEFNEGAIKNAKSINFFDDNFEEKLLKLDKEKPVFLYCKAGGRSGKASKTLKKLGFKEIYDLKGGYLEWKKNK